MGGGWLSVCVCVCACVLVVVEATDVSVSEISPTFGSVDGGTGVTVTGVGFINPNGSAVCRFYGDGGLVYGEGPLFTPAVVHNSTTLTCKSPPFPQAAAVHLEVSMRGVNFTDSHVLYSFVRYLDASPSKSLFTCGSAVYDSPDAASVLVVVDPMSPKAVLTSRDKFPVVVKMGSVTVGKATVAADGRVHAIPVSLVSISAGACPFNKTLTATFDCQGCPTEARPVPFLLMPFKSNQVAVDYTNRGLVVNNAPFYTYGWFVDGKVSWGSLKGTIIDMSHRGVNALMVYMCTTSHTDPPCMRMDTTKAVLDLAYGLGMRVQVSLLQEVIAVFRNETQHWLSYVNESVVTLMDHPALLGWYITDDTIIYTPSKVADVYDMIRATDPWHPVFNTISGSGNAWEFQSPRRGFDVAQYEAYDLSDPFWQLPTIPLNWPMRFVPGSICGQGYNDDETLAAAPRLQAFATMLGGGTGYILWDWWLWNHYVSRTVTYSHTLTVHEVMEVAAGLLSSTLNQPAVNITGPKVAAGAYQRDDGTVLVVAANGARSPTQFTLTLPFLPTAPSNTLPVLFSTEEAVFDSANGTALTSFLDGMEVKVFVYTPGSDKRRQVDRVGGGHRQRRRRRWDPAALQLTEGVSADPSPGENWVNNPSFEQSSAPGHVNAWYEVLKFFSDSTSLLFDFDMFPDPMLAAQGTHSLRITLPSADALGYSVFIPFPIVDGHKLSTDTTYNFTLHLRTGVVLPDQPTNVTLCATEAPAVSYPPTPADLVSMGSGTNGTAMLGPKDAHQWHALSYVGRPPLFQAGLCVSGSGVLWVDSVSVVETM